MTHHLVISLSSFNVCSQPGLSTTESTSGPVDLSPPSLLLQIKAYLQPWASMYADHLQYFGRHLVWINALSLVLAFSFSFALVCCTFEDGSGNSSTALLLVHWSNFSHCFKLLGKRHLSFCSWMCQTLTFQIPCALADWKVPFLENLLV